MKQQRQQPAHRACCLMLKSEKGPHSLLLLRRWVFTSSPPAHRLHTMAVVAQVRRASLLASLNGDDGETLNKAAEDKVPKSKYERAIAELFKDKEGMHKIMLAQAPSCPLTQARSLSLYLHLYKMQVICSFS